MLFSHKLITATLMSAFLLSACQTSPNQLKAFQKSTAITQNNYYQTTLDNGLNIVIKKDHRAPIAMTQVWYKVGSNDEPIGKGGMSHFLEHMMFKDNAHLKRTQFNRLIGEFGGQNNAFTTDAHTAYYELFPANYYPLAMQIESFRMQDLHLKDSEVATEKQVIKEERRLRTDDNPLAKAYEEFLALSQPNSPKSRPVIGSMADIEGLTTADLQAWYNKYYAPNNATLVVVGNVDYDEVIANAKKYFGHKKPINTPKRQIPTQPTHQGYRHAVTHQSVNTPSIMMAYNVPSITTSDKATAHALSLFQYALDGDMSSYFERILVREKQLFSQVYASYDAYSFGDELFLIQATPRAGVDLQTAEQAILEVINTAQNTLITDQEMTRFSTSLFSELTFAQDNIAVQAQMIGMLANMGLPINSYDKLSDELKRIRPSDVQKIAKQYLTKDNLTTLYILPKYNNQNYQQ